MEENKWGTEKINRTLWITAAAAVFVIGIGVVILMRSLYLEKQEKAKEAAAQKVEKMQEDREARFKGEKELEKEEKNERQAEDVENGVEFSKVDQEVTAREEVNLRSSMEQGTEENVVCSLKNGDIARRTGIGMNGWSRVEYDGKTLYCVSSYLTADLGYTPPKGEEFKTKFTDVSQNVTAKELTNLRDRPSIEEPSQIIAELKHGEVIVRTGISNEGWSRVEYAGKTLYCISSYMEVVE